jgi:hypothetical protein
MIIGDITFDDAVSAVIKAQDILKREVNPVVYPTDEFRKRIIEKHDFITDVIQGEKIFVIGDEDGLARLGK